MRLTSPSAGLDPGGRPHPGWPGDRLGLLVFFGLPILAVLALVPLVGSALGLEVLATLGPIYALGYGTTAWIVGRSALRAPVAWIVVFLVGWVILLVAAPEPPTRQ